MTKSIKVPPDGGYGWVVVFAMALANVVGIPIIQNFGLIFKDTFTEMGLSATQGSLIINVNAAFGMLIGLINGLLLKFFGYRKVALLGGFFFSGGVVLTSFATSFVHFIITYGLITSIGFGLTYSAFGLALNTYFRDRRSKAMGYTMTITGFGPIIMPQFIYFLMENYTVSGVTLILGAIVGHAIVSAVLLQPVKWHMKKVVLEDEEEGKIVAEEDENKTTLLRTVSEVEGETEKNSLAGSVWSIDHDIETPAIYGLDSAIGGSVLSLHSTAPTRRTSTISVLRAKSISNLHDKHHHQLAKSQTMEKPKKKPLWKRILLTISRFFDFDLMKDPIYVNIMFGMSLAIFAEMNFSILTPFILSDFQLNTSQIATFLSVLGIADIAFRFFSPYIGEYLNKPPRPMYTLSLLMLITTRFSLLISNNFYVLLVMAGGLGIAKGIRTVYMSLVIPTHVPLEKLASASGIQMMVNGICILIGGPILGFVRDKTGSYTMCIVIMNCVTLTTVLIWSIEGLVVKYKEKKRKKMELKQFENVEAVPVR